MACFFTRGGRIFSIQPQHSNRPALRILLYSAQTIFSSTDNAGRSGRLLTIRATSTASCNALSLLAVCVAHSYVSFNSS